MTPCPVGARGCASRRLASRRHFRCAPIPLAHRATASLRSRCALKPLSPRGDGSRSARPSGLHCLPTTHGDAPCARRLCSCALSAPSPCAPSTTRRRRLSDSPALPAHRQTEPSVPPSYFLPPAPRRPSHAPRRTRLRPYDTPPPRALDSDRHPAQPPPDATLPSPPLRAAGGLPVSRGLARRDADSVAHLRACRPRPPQVPVTAQAAAAAREEHGTDPRGGVRGQRC